jgi:hypothetical protein
MQAIEDCRTAALGGHLEACDRCGAEIAHYHSCRNRHCPKCQTLAKERWVEARAAELLPVPYFHLVFTLPHEINSLAQGNPKVIDGLLFQAASDTLQTFGRDPKWLGGEIGITMVLHTWGQNLSQCALSRDRRGTRSRGTVDFPKRGFLFRVRALSIVFRAKYLEALKGAFEAGQLDFAGETLPLAIPSVFGTFLTTLRTKGWVVYAKRPFGGPEQVLAYLGRYTHRIAISNERLLACENGEVRFRWRDYAHGNKVKVMRLPVEEFIRRFLPTCSPRASCGSGTMASSPIAIVPSIWTPVGPPSMRLLRRLPNPKPSRPSSLACSAPTQTAARTALKEGCAPSNAFRLSPRATGPPFLRWAA